MDEQKESSIREEASKEANRITELLVGAEIDDRKMQILAPIIENTAWMKAKLDDARRQIRNSSIVVPYNNGGGQKGLKENPLFKGYEALWKSYMAGMSKIIDALPVEAVEVKEIEMEKPKTMLDIIRERHGA